MVTILIYKDVEVKDGDNVTRAKNNTYDDGEEILYIWQIDAVDGKATFTVTLPDDVKAGDVAAVAIGTENNQAATYAATGAINVVADAYTVTWKNEDGTVLETDTVEAGTVPTYDGTTPTKAATAEHTYTFDKWTPEVVAATANATYTATYTETKNKYTVTWVVGETSTTEQVEYGTVPTFTGSTDKAADAQYTYTFAGWDAEPVAVTGDVTYTATYTSKVNSYTVKFVNDDDSVIEEKTYEYGEMPVAPTATKVADAQYTYTFKAWDNEVVAVTGEATYKATYTSVLNTYKVVWKNEDGTVLETDDAVAYGETPEYNGATPTKAATAQYTYTFKDWTPVVDTVTGEIEYTATYTETLNEYTITWKNDDGSVIDTTTVAYGVVPTHAAPEKEATAQYTYTFSKWSPDVVAVVGEATYTAEFTETLNEYTVTWSVDGVVTTEKVAYGTVPTAPTNTDKDKDAQYTYTFVGWDKDVVAVTGDVTYTAQYEKTVNSYTVKFVGYGNADLGTKTVDYGATVEAPTAPEVEGYTFTGWDKSLENIVKDTTITATYTINTYKVTWTLNGEAYGTPSTFEYGATVTAPAYEAKEGYTFSGWAVPEKMPAENITLNATETVNTYTITWIVDGEEDVDTYEFGAAVTAPANPTKEGYTFAGWGAEVPATMPAKDLTFTAVFEEIPANEWTVTYVDGETTTEVKVAKENATTTLKENTAATFAGWEATVDGERVFLPSKAEYTLTGDITFTAVYARVSILDGAAIRLVKGESGIRFTAYADEIVGAKYGTILTLDANITASKIPQYTLEDIQTFNNANNNAFKCANVVAKTSSMLQSTNNNYQKEFRTVMIVPQEEYNRPHYALDWAARSYVTVKYTDSKYADKTIYSDTYTKRSPKTVATANQKANYEGCDGDATKIGIVDEYAADYTASAQ